MPQALGPAEPWGERGPGFDRTRQGQPRTLPPRCHRTCAQTSHAPADRSLGEPTRARRWVGRRVCHFPRRQPMVCVIPSSLFSQRNEFLKVQRLKVYFPISSFSLKSLLFDKVKPTFSTIEPFAWTMHILSVHCEGPARPGPSRAPCEATAAGVLEARSWLGTPTNWKT